MGGMKDEAKSITIPPLFPRVHVNDTGRGCLSPTFRGKSMSIYKCSTLPSPALRDSSNLSLSLPPLPPPPKTASLADLPEKIQFSPIRNISPVTKFEETVIKDNMNYQSLRGLSFTTNKSSSIKQNEYHFKNLSNSDYRKVRSLEIDPKANTDLSLQFCTSSSSSSNSKAGREAPLKNTDVRKLVFSECLKEESQNMSFNGINTQLYRSKTLTRFNNEAEMKNKTVTQREQDDLDSSAADSLSSMSASSNDIARVIGDKRFWKIRTYMVNQQKIFAVQVFELHKLIMVQKMIAKSPNLVLKSKLNGSIHGAIRSSHLLEMATSKFTKPNTENHKHVTEEYPDHMKPKLPLPSLTKELVTPIWPQRLLPPHPGNQWLVPVMSPSEGFVYKPYTGPHPPPPTAFMVPMYGQDSGFRYPVSHQFNHSYNTQSPNSSQRWSNASSHLTKASPFSLKKSQESDESDELQSTASSPPKEPTINILPLFPTEPTHNHTDEETPKEKPLLRAIPFNPISASEPVARIYRSIQNTTDHMIS